MNLPSERAAARVAGGGALRGLAAGAGYAVLLSLVLAVEDRVAGVPDAVPGGLAVLLIALVVAAPVGALAGALLGLVLWPLARAVAPAAAAAVAALLVGGLGLLAFPQAVIGGSRLEVGEVLTLRLLPAALAALAAARHAWVTAQDAR